MWMQWLSPAGLVLDILGTFIIALEIFQLARSRRALDAHRTEIVGLIRQYIVAETPDKARQLRLQIQGSFVDDFWKDSAFNFWNQIQRNRTISGLILIILGFGMQFVGQWPG